MKVFTRFMHVFFDTSKNAQRLFEVVLWKVGSDKEKDVIYLHAKRGRQVPQGQPIDRIQPRLFLPCD